MNRRKRLDDFDLDDNSIVDKEIDAVSRIDLDSIENQRLNQLSLNFASSTLQLV